MKRGNFMNKTNMLKVLLVIMVTLGLVFATTEVFADDTLDLSNTLQGGNIDLNSIDTNNIDLNSIDTNNIDLNSIDTNNIDLNSINTNTGNGTGTNNTNKPTNENNATQNTNSNTSSSYAESDIPHAGIETSVLTIAAFIVCAIIGAYTFIKLSDYSNI